MVLFSLSSFGAGDGGSPKTQVFSDCNSTQNIAPSVILSTCSNIDTVAGSLVPPNPGSPASKPVQGTLVQLSRATLDGKIKDLIEQKQNLLIQSVCISPKPEPEKTTLAELFPAAIGVAPHALGSGGMAAPHPVVYNETYAKCLRAISDLWENPEQLMGFLANDSILNNYMKSHAHFMDSNFLVLSVIKNVRAKLATLYFQKTLTAAFESSGISAEEMKHITGIGFNRLFSPQNTLGASPASDVDFNLIFDDKYFEALPPKNTKFKNRSQEVEFILRGSLVGAKKDFDSLLHMDLEVADFAVKPLYGVIVDSLKKKADPKVWEPNFLATVIDNESYLMGDSALKDAVISTVKKELGAERSSRAYRQYVSKDTHKGSIGVVLNLDQIKADPQLADMTKKFDQNYVGTTSAHVGNWNYNTKYFAARLYDYAPSHPKARMLNEVALNFQYLVIQSLTDPVTGKPNLKTVGDRYEKVNTEVFKSLAQKFPHAVEEVIGESCSNGLVAGPYKQSVCVPHDLKKMSPSQVGELGFHYFSELMSAGTALSKELDPH